MSKFNELVTKLREIFQIDRPELDFGVYRILNARADEINEYLEKRLKEKVEEALASGSAANLEQLKEELKKAEQGAQALGVDADTVPKVQELKAKISEATSGSADHENAVFSHLLTFFSRYYDQGDFISQRRYKGDTYAIPYAGEEVMLHWANKDQYYIKRGENFSNYSFKLEDGRIVHFRLVSADTAKDNRKDNDKERRFVLAEPRIINRVDDEGDEYEEEVLPVEEIVKTDTEGNESKELIIRFEYKVVSKGRGNEQAKFVDSAVSTILANDVVAARWLDVGKRAPTEKNPKRTLLEKHLTNYTTKNTSDYFIHKNLSLFLRGELDFYIKNEVLHLDDVSNAESFSDIEKNLRMIQCLRSIATDLIAFLSQLEDFQKKLWNKKKFVVDSYYCVTLDLIDEKFHAEIVDNIAQWQQWHSLGLWEANRAGTIAELRSSPNRLVDLGLFSKDFQSKVVSDIENLDERTNGILINSENYQAANLIKNKVSNMADLVYLDPPYNTDATPIIYKNGYKESSWATLMADRIELSTQLLTKNGVIAYAIDDTEASLLKEIEKQLNPSRDVFQCVVEHYPGSGTGRSNVSRTHEYCIFSVAGDDDVLRGDAVEDGTRKRGFRRAGTGDNNFRIGSPGRPESFFAVLVDKQTFEVKGVEPPPPPVEKGNYPLEDTSEGFKRVYPIGENGDERVWSLSYEGAKQAVVEGRIVSSDKFVISRLYHDEARRLLLPSVWQGSQYNATTGGTNLLTGLFGDAGRFSYPKALGTMSRVLESVLHNKTTSLTVDLFGGSGTTAHAVIERNRLNEENHKYLLVEMGSHSDLVIKERISKVVYSQSWANGQPVINDSGSSHCLKVLKLESYEDALNNITLTRSVQQQDLLGGNTALKEDYQLNYMLNAESRNSLLSTDDFKKPFDYSMNITTDSAGAYREQKVDLVETFNFLIGLTIKHIDAQPERGFVTVTGTLPTGESCLILWRDCDLIDYRGLNKLCDKLAINPADNEFDVVYINGDHNIPTVLTQTAEEGGETRVLKLRQIEPEFLDRMFAEEDV